VRRRRALREVLSVFDPTVPSLRRLAADTLGGKELMCLGRPTLSLHSTHYMYEIAQMLS
jgi:hypothetical protein